jgi:phospholipid/cholesterol/gamma-HCH transport system substrate-binding protein
MSPTGIRALTGLATVAVIAAIVYVAVGLFQGTFTKSTPVTVISSRAGLVMNPDAKVQMRGVVVGKVDSIEPGPNGQAVLHLAMHPADMHLIPKNVTVNITAPTVFGAKYVDLVPPPNPSKQPLYAGEVLDSQHVTVEIDTLFQRLTTVLDRIDPTKLNETFGALAQALSGRGAKIGQAFSDLDSFLAKYDSALPALSHDIEVLPAVANAYADASPDLIRTIDNSSKISKSIVDEQHNLDAFLVSAIGLADIGNDVLTTNRQLLPAAFRLLAPTTDLTNEYHPALECSLKALVLAQQNPPQKEPGVYASANFVWAGERYRYPTNLPKVAATGGPNCLELPDHAFDTYSKYLVTDDGANPWVYGNPQILINSDVLKQLLYGPIAGPPRNSSLTGNPG